MPAQKTLASRFRFYINTNPTPTGCYLWMGGRTSFGYGQFYVKGKNVIATHVAWFLATGTWPKLNILHRCDTPACTRYEHLFEGTLKDNAHDMMQKNRHYLKSGEKNPFAKLTWERVLWIREEYAKGVVNQRELAEICQLSPVTICHIVRNKSWLQPVEITSTGNATNTL